MTDVSGIIRDLLLWMSFTTLLVKYHNLPWDIENGTYFGSRNNQPHVI
jgi:hypothetical protein